MSIYFLNCGSMRPYFPPVKNGVTCLLVETNHGPVLVDTGLGTQDYQNPGRRMNFFLKMMRSKRDINETALYQLGRLGYKREDVRHIIQTHLHLDHAGGLSDFPGAQVHVHNQNTITSCRIAVGNMSLIIGDTNRIGCCTS